MNKGSWIRIAIFLLIGAIGGVAIYASPDYFQKKNQPAHGPHLNAGGSSVVFFIMDKWKDAYKKDKEIDLRYHSSGSTEGVAQVIDGRYQIGFTSSPLTEEQRTQARAKGGDIIQVPVVLIGVVPVYKLPELQDKPPLKFTGDVLAKIFLGKITQWNDKELADLNPDVQLPDKKITVVCRKDSSGTTFTFTNYLHGASELWRKEMGPASALPDWKGSPNQVERNSGVAIVVKSVEGAIGYVELINAVATQLQYGAVQNSDKSEFVLAGPDTLKAAAKAALALNDSPGELPTNLTNSTWKTSYPISAVEWAVCYKVQPAADSKTVSEFMTWITHEGQDYSKILQKVEAPPKEVKGRTVPVDRSSEARGKALWVGNGYSPLPEEFVQRAEEKLKLITSK